MTRRYYVQVYNNNELVLFGNTTGPESLIELGVPLEENAQEIWDKIVNATDRYYSTYHIHSKSSNLCLISILNS